MENNNNNSSKKLAELLASSSLFGRGLTTSGINALDFSSNVYGSASSHIPDDVYDKIVYSPPNTPRSSLVPFISRDLFMETFRSSDFHKLINDEDAIEIFMGVLKGSSDLTADRLNALLADYSVGNLAVVDAEPTYYLFGGDACKIYEDYGAEKLVASDESYELFTFFEGVTSSREFVEVALGWLNYMILTKDTYDQLYKLTEIKSKKDEEN